MTWNDRFTRAEKTGEFTKKDLRTARSWGSCALGDRLGIGEYGVIEDYEDTITKEAYDKGCEFTEHVKHNRIAEAKKSYEEIQKMRFVYKRQSDCEGAV